MSRLGKKPILLPKGVETKLTKSELQLKGAKGTLVRTLPDGILLKIDDEKIIVEIDQKSNVPKPMYGLYRSLINNDVIGVSQGFEKQLSLIGVGYRAAVKGDTLDLQMGFSHPSQLKIPNGLTVTVEKSTSIKIIGSDKQLVGQFAADVRAVRPPEPYKGKGIRYADEYVRKKAGKAAKGK